MDQSVQIVSPRRDLLKTVEQLFMEDSSGRRLIVRHLHTWQPPTDLYELDDTLVARIEIAGMKDGALSVSISEQDLTVSGVRQNSGRQGAFHQMEIQYGEFRTRVRLPANVDEEHVEASYADGFLTVLMPKRAAQHVKIVSQDIPRDSEDEPQ